MQNFTRILCLASLVLSLTAIPAHADDTFLNYLLPSIFGEPDRGPKPQETLVAPFAQNKLNSRILSENEQKSLKSPENSLPLNVAHRSDKYIAEWAAERVTSVFVYESDKLKLKLTKAGTDLRAVPTMEMGDFLTKEFVKSFDEFLTPDGKAAALKQLTDSGVLNAMKTQQQVRAFSRDIPQILNDGIFNDVYRWLVDVPITLSIMPAGMTSYTAKTKTADINTQNILIRIQIGRMSPDKGFPDGMAIESFTIIGAPS